MKNKLTRREFGATTLATVLASAMPAPFVWAQEKKYDPGASDTEIKLGPGVPAPMQKAAGNPAEQNRPFGAVRGAPPSLP
mgnify:CR=1 FL=1